MRTEEKKKVMFNCYIEPLVNENPVVLKKTQSCRKRKGQSDAMREWEKDEYLCFCLLYTSDAADE